MKFVIAVVMLALAAGAQSGLLPYPYIGAPLSYTAVSGPHLLAAAPAHYAVHGPAHYDVHAHLPAAVAVHTHAHAHAAHIPAIVHHAPAAIVAHEGSYVAQTRGAIHTAPLPGHINSAASINLEPAPGTL